MDSITIDWREDTVRYYRDLICRGLGITPEELERDERLTAYYQGIAGTAIAERMQPSAVECGIIAGRVTPTEHMLEIARDAEIANTTLNDFRGLRAAIRDLIDGVMANFDTFFKAYSSFIEIQVLCVRDEFVWKMKRRKRTRWLNEMESGRITEVEYQDLCAREQAKIPNQQEYSFNWESTHITPVEYWDNLRAQGQAAAIRNCRCSPYPETEEEIENWQRSIHSMGIGFCTPSRSRLTGRQ